MISRDIMRHEGAIQKKKNFIADACIFLIFVKEAGGNLPIWLCYSGTSQKVSFTVSIVYDFFSVDILEFFQGEECKFFLRAP